MKKAKFTLEDMPTEPMPQEDSLEEEISSKNIELTSAPKKKKEKKQEKKVKKIKIKKEKIKKERGRPRKISGGLDANSAEAIQLYISKCRKVHGPRYNYQIERYPSANEKIKITCKEHGIFEQRSVNHLRGSGCRKCSRKKKEAIPKKLKVTFSFESSTLESVDLFEREAREVAKRLNLQVEVKRGKSAH